jgi:hypothetical protein
VPEGGTETEMRRKRQTGDDEDQGMEGQVEGQSMFLVASSCRNYSLSLTPLVVFGGGVCAAA